MLKHLLSLSSVSLVVCVIGVLFLYHLVKLLLDPLKDIPGPFLARFTRFWYFWEIYRGSFEATDVELHRKYGPIIRIAPGEYSIDDAEAAKTIYGHGNAFVKVSKMNISL